MEEKVTSQDDCNLMSENRQKLLGDEGEGAARPMVGAEGHSELLAV